MTPIKHEREIRSVDSLFAALGRAVVHFRYLIVVAWLVATVLAVKGLPSLSSVSNNNNSAFLPMHEPSMVAAQLAAPFQHGTAPTALIVAGRAGRPLTAADQSAISRAEAAARRVKNVADVRDEGISGDGMARKALIELSASASQGGSDSKTVVDAIRATFSTAGAPSGLSLYLTGELATSVDNQQASNKTLALTEILAVVFILVLLFCVYRALLAPFLTLLPAGLVVVIGGPVIAQAHNAIGVQISPITQIMLVILVLGAGTDYGIFLVFRVREELRRGLEPYAAIVKSLTRVGETITFSAGTVIGALLCLLLASLGFYQGLGPALAIGIGIMLLVGLTLTPALLAICGKAVFWPTGARPNPQQFGAWGRISARVLRRPGRTLAIGLVIFGGLALGVLRYSAAGFGENGTTSSTSQSAQGTAILSAHFPAAQANPTNLLFTYATSVWQQPSVLAAADTALRTQHVFSSISGPLNPNGSPLSPSQLRGLHTTLGPASALPPVPAASISVAATLYNAYRSTAQFISPDGKTVQFYATLAAGDPSGTSAMQAMPAARQAVSRVALATHATNSGVGGVAAFSADISNVSNSDILHVAPVVLLVIAILLAIVLRSLVAPWYLIASVGLSYLSALGLSVAVFEGIGGGPGLSFILPFFMFIFIMALGSDYNILVMTRIREEAHEGPLREAVIRAINATGGTVTSAGLILAGSFAVLTVAGGGQIQQIGLGIASGILMDTFLIRTLLIPALVVIIGKWNWFPSPLYHLAADHAAARTAGGDRAAGAFEGLVVENEA